MSITSLISLCVLYSSLFSVLGSVLKKLVLSVEVMPTAEQGLGVKLANNSTNSAEGGCIVKTIAETSSARGILQPGDKLVLQG